MAVYQGYLGKNNDLLKMLSSASSNYAKSKAKELEDEQERRLIEAQKEQAKEEKKQQEKNLFNDPLGVATDLGKGILSTGQKIVGTASQGVDAAFAAANLVAGDTKKAAEWEKRIRDIGKEKTVTGESMSFISDYTLEGKNNPGQFAAEFTKAGADTAAFVQPQLKAGSLLTKVGSEVGINATASGLASGADQFAKDGNIDIGKVAEDATLGGLTAGIFRGVAEIPGSIRNASNSKELNKLLNTNDINVTPEARTELNKLAKEGLKGKEFKVRVAKIVSDDTAKQAEALRLKEQENTDIAALSDRAEAGMARVADKAELENRPFRDTSDEELAKGIEAFQSGERSADTVEADYGRYQKMVDELSLRQNAKDREAFLANGLPNDVKGAEEALANFDNRTNLPDSVYKQAAPIESVAQALVRDDIPVEIKNAAQEVVQDRKMVEDQLFTLMSPEKYDAEISRLDDEYNANLDALTKRYSSLEQPTRGKDTTVDQKVDGQRLSGDYKSDVRFSVAKDKLDEQYKNDVAELDLLREQDRPDVEQLQQIIDTLERRDLQITRDVNRMMEASPDSFRDIDGAEFDARRQEVVDNLEQAKRFNEPSRVIDEVSQTSDPVATFDSTPDAEPAFEKDIANNVNEMEAAPAVASSFKNLPATKAAAIRYMSPSQVLEKWGLRGPELDVHTDILRAESALNAANKADSEVLTRINEILPSSPESQRQIVEYLEGSRKTLSSMDEESATMIRNFLDEKKAGLEKMGFKTLDDYFPHMFDPKDPEVARLFKGKASTDIKFGNLKQRLSDSDNYSRDIMEVLTQYTSSYNRKTILEPALKPLDNIRTQVKLQDAESLWLDEYINQLKGFDSSRVGDAYNTFMDSVLEKMGKTNAVGQNHYASHLGTQRMISAAATMGLNPGTAIRNMTQMVNTVAELGPRYSTLGIWDGMKALRAGPGSPEWRELQAAGIMEGGVSQNYFDAISKPGIRGRVAHGRDAAVKGLMSMIRGTDILLRSQAYYGAKALATKNGLVGKAAEDFAIRKVIDTQFITSRVDMPVAFNSQGIRSLTQLATFSGKQAGFLKRTGLKMIKNKDGTYGINPKEMGNVLAAVTTAALATEALKPLMGFREEEWIPFYDQFAPFVPEEALNAVGLDKSGGDSLYRSPLVTLLAGDGKSKAGLIQALQGQDVNGDGTKSIGEGIEKFFQDQWSSLVPAGTQLKKTREGIQTTTGFDIFSGQQGPAGESRNKSGNIRYLQDMDMDSQLKASLFGQYSTEAGQNWIKQGFPTLSEKQTEKVDAQPSRAVKEQYADYYVARQGVSGRQDAYDAIMDAAKSGDVNKVARLSKEFNAKVDDAMSKYYQKHDNLPKELQEDMMKLRINATNVLKKARDDEE